MFCLTQSLRRDDLPRLPPTIEGDDNLFRLAGTRYRSEVMTDEIHVIDTLAEAAFNLLVHFAGLTEDDELYATIWEETCLVASYQAEGDPMGNMMGRNV